MVNLPLSKQKKDIHICKRFGVVVVIVATSLTHPTSVSMGMNMRLLEEINLVVVILNKTNNMENQMKRQDSTEYKTNKETEYHTFRFHAYDDRRGGSVSPWDWESKVKELGYDAKRDGGINWYIFQTNCPKEKCSEILNKLSK